MFPDEEKRGPEAVCGDGRSWTSLALESLDEELLSYPRPLLRRAEWTSLDGPWQFAFDDGRHLDRAPEGAEWTHTIRVPFAPESAKSGVHDQGFHQGCWYEREVDLAPARPGERVRLHFGAVDYEARVWVNGQLVGSHRGGHTPFSFDVTSVLRADGQQTITVHAVDDPFDLAKPRGKQDWQLEPHSIWYPRTTGIWQTGLARADPPATYVDCLSWTPHLERWEIGCRHRTRGRHRGTTCGCAVLLRVKDHVLVDDTYKVIAREVHRRIALSDPGIDDFRNELLWSPESRRSSTREIDAARRRAAHHPRHGASLHGAALARRCSGDRFMLNGRPYPCASCSTRATGPDR
jgi:hypothetical protein